jgi:short-subunit dehydrogenase
MHTVITGASAGIGAALARAFGQAGHDLTLVARRRERLEALAEELAPTSRVHVVTADLCDSDQATAWIDGAIEALGPVDVLVNNAGAQIVAPTHETDIAAAERTLFLNLNVPLRLTHRVLPSMIARSTGTIVDIASMAALAPTPGMTWYNAAKGGLAGASEALRAEVLPHGVHVVTVYPGIIPTDMGKAGLAAYQSTLTLRMQPQGDPDTLARLVLQAVEKRRSRVIYPVSNALARHFPGLTRWAMDKFSPTLSGGDSDS